MGCPAEIFPDPIEGAASQSIVGLLRPVEAHPEDIDGHIEGQGPVRGCGRAEKAVPGIAGEVTEGPRAVAPQQGLAPLEHDDPAAGAMQRIEGRRGCLPADMRPVVIVPPMVGAGGASQIALVGELEACQQRQIPAQDFSSGRKKPARPRSFANDVRVCVM